MDIPIALFLGFIAMTLAIVVFGIIKRIPVLILAGGIFLIFWSVSTDNILMDFSASGIIPDIYHYDVTSSTGQLLLNAVTGSSIAERPTTSSSILIGDTIDCITVYIGKSGSPPESTITFGVFDVNNNVISSFGTRTVASITSTAVTPYTHCLPIGTTHTIGTSQHIGVKYNAGDASNTLTMRVDGNNPFDGTITDRAQFTTLWVGSSGQDVMMQMYLRGSEDVITNIPFEFTEIPKTLFSFFGIMIMVVSLVISKYGD